MKDLKSLYDVRFSQKERAVKQKVWEILCKEYFQNFISPEDTLLEIACGFGEFSNNIKAKKKIAIDLNSSVRNDLAPEIQFYEGSAENLSMIKSDSIDICFTSNFFEHLPDKKTMDNVLTEILRVLKPGGRLMAMQPNIKYSGDSYWDFYDHHLPLSHNSAAEGFAKNGFQIELLIPKFVPFSTKSRLPKTGVFVSVYLKIPFLWNIFGKQFVIIGKKPN